MSAALHPVPSYSSPSTPRPNNNLERLSPMKSAQALFVNNALKERGYLPNDEFLNLSDERTAEVCCRLISTIDAARNSSEEDSDKIAKLRAVIEDFTKKHVSLGKACDRLEGTVQSKNIEVQRLLVEVTREKESKARLEKELARTTSAAAFQKKQFAADIRKRDGLINRLESELRNRLSLTSYEKQHELKFNGTWPTLHPRKEPTASHQSLLLFAPNVRKSLLETTFEQDQVLIEAITKINDKLESQFSGILALGDGGEPNSIARDYPLVKLQRYIGLLQEALSTPEYVERDVVLAKDEEIAALKMELAETTANWRKTMATMDSWISYRQEHTGP